MRRRQRHDSPATRPDRQYTASRFARLARRPAKARQTGAVDPRQHALATLIGRLPLRIIMTDREMRVLAMSASQTAGMDGEAHVGRSLFDVDPDYFGPFRPICERCLAGESILFPQVRGREGKAWLRNEIGPWRDSRGRIGGLLSVSVDITDMVEALRASERAQARLNMAVGIADLHVWEVDYATGTVVTAGAADTFFDGSYDTAAMIADPTLAIHPDDRERVVEPWAQAVMADTPFRAEYRVNRSDEALVWGAASVKLLKNEAGEPVSMIGAIQNITAQKQTELALIQAKEDAEAANRAKSVFLATMSHEVRTPLNGVLGMAQAMAADDLPAAQRSRLETIRQSGESLLVILNDVLDLSKIEAGKLELEAVDFPLSPLLHAIHASFRDLAGAKGLALDFEIAAGAPGLYRGDPTRLRQILFNLLSNGLKFTEAGRIGLSARRDQGVLTFTVRDTGVGIPADRLGRLFNKFEQADASTTRRFGGTGLGLAISRDLAGLMGGALEADSREGEGSEFRLSVPLRRLGDEDTGEPAARDAAPVRAVSLRVLAAEDNHVNQLVLRTLLQQVGVEPVIVDDGAAAVAAWRGQDWDLILMDVQMPVMDGPTATRAIRAAEAAAGRRRTPVVALTANAMSHQVAEYAAAGMDGFIAKPIRVEELYAALEGVLDGDQTAAA